MLGCDERLTLVQCVKEQDGDRYLCVPIVWASWYRKKAIAITADGAKPVNTCTVRIPDGVLPAEVIPTTDDFMVRGIVEAVTRAPADLTGLDYMRITAVGDNRRGRLRHWAVSGA